MISVSAPGKIILAGEHAVVYGKSALVAAVDKRLTVKVKKKTSRGVKILSTYPPEQIKEAIEKLKQASVTCCDRNKQPPLLWDNLVLEVNSQIPVKVGMGSSAAVAVATVGALLAFLKKLKKFSLADKKIINEIAYEVERRIHGTPSGVDNTISSFGGFLWFKKGEPFKRIKLRKLPRFVLINTGRAEETTGEMVENVKFKMQNAKLQSKIKNLFNKIERETRRLLVGLKEGNKKKIMRAVRECERGLEKLGVVGEFAQKLIREIERIGGVAKICGAGGVRDRSGILLCYHQNPKKIFALAKRLKLQAFEVKLGEEGVRIE